jgi:5-methylcytosine-specific restriction endonuclease McrA
MTAWMTPFDPRSCATCGETFYSGHNRQATCGLDTCKTALVARRNAEWRLNNAESRAAYLAAYEDARRGTRHEYAAEHYAKNKDRLLANNREWVKANRARRRQWTRDYHAANSAKRVIQATQWRKDNPEANALIKANAQRRRSARKRGAQLFKVSGGDFAKCLRRFHHRCAYCSADIRAGYQFDHVMPVSRGGVHGIGNLVPCCGPCNVRKHSRTVMEWRMAQIRQDRKSTQREAVA